MKANNSRNKDSIRSEYDENQANIGSEKVKNFAQQTIWGQNIINVRSFNIDAQRNYEFIGSFTRNVPIYPSPEIAFVGRSNVGKSSLLNCLTGLSKKIAVESKIPGRTRAINMFKCSDRSGAICNFVDLPGYGFAKMSKDMKDDVNQFVQSYLVDRGALRLAVLLIDIRRDIQDSDLSMAQVNYSFL